MHVLKLEHHWVLSAMERQNVRGILAVAWRGSEPYTELLPHEFLVLCHRILWPTRQPCVAPWPCPPPEVDLPLLGVAAKWQVNGSIVVDTQWTLCIMPPLTILERGPPTLAQPLLSLLRRAHCGLPACGLRTLTQCCKGSGSGNPWTADECTPWKMR